MCLSCSCFVFLLKRTKNAFVDDYRGEISELKGLPLKNIVGKPLLGCFCSGRGINGGSAGSAEDDSDKQFSKYSKLPV